MAFFFAFRGVAIQWAKEREQMWIALLSLVAKCEWGGTTVPGRGKLLQQEGLRSPHQSSLCLRSKSSLGHGAASGDLFTHSLSKCS